MNQPLRIAINAQIIPGTGAGGIETVVRFLTSLARLDGEEEYVFIAHRADDSDWLKPFENERLSVIKAPGPKPQTRSRLIELFKRPLRPVVRRTKHLISKPPAVRTGLPRSDGFYESLNCDVIHFPYQDFVETDMPSLFNPHDLQHLHFPQYFTPEEIQRRESLYPAACRSAHTVIAASRFVKNDLIEKYGLDADKIQVIPWHPTGRVSDDFSKEEVRRLFEKYDLPERPFALYPAVTWEHKNHIRLLEALALLRNRGGSKLHLVCTGHRNPFYPTIEKRMKELGVDEQVRFTGVVEQEELSILYHKAQFVVIPTLFEAASAPLFEAWQHDVPVACSDVTSLPEQAGDAALLFDPFSVEKIAGALDAMMSDEKLRAGLRSRAAMRLRSGDPNRTLKTYRAAYRRAAGVALNEEDKLLLK